MSSEISDSDEGTSSEDKNETPAKKRKMQKTPISILTELCTQKKVSQPVFIELDVSSLSEKFSDMKFAIKCTALGKSAIGASMTKKLAKHTAADNVLKKCRYEVFSDDEDDDVPNTINNNDFVSELLNLCVQKNFHKPDFILTESFGPTHCPTFTYECRLDSLVRKGSATNKKLAKNIAAKNVLDILKLSYPDQEKKVALVNDQNMAKEEARRKITSYLELKSRDKVDKMGTLLSDRHNFFVNYKDEEFINSLKDILLENINLKAKYDKFLQELKTEWEYNITNFADLDLKMFELFIDFDQFTVNLVCMEEDLESTVINYFMNMLHLVSIQNYIPGTVLSLDDIKLVPLK